MAGGAGGVVLYHPQQLQAFSPVATSRYLERRSLTDSHVHSQMDALGLTTRAKLCTETPTATATAPTAPHEGDQSPPTVFNADRIVGTGTFGIVYSANSSDHGGEKLAVKKVFVDKRFRNKELQVWFELQDYGHPNIVNLKQFFFTKGDTCEELYLNMVMEFMPENVYSVIRRYTKEKSRLPRILVVLYGYQLCRALGLLHSCQILHRDIKPQNLLVNPQQGHVLKLCDFGSSAYSLARAPQSRKFVAYICSRFYRAPELIFGSEYYTPAVDMWSSGCVLAEMIGSRPPFQGTNGVSQIFEIVKVLGTPSQSELTAMSVKWANFKGLTLPKTSWSCVLQQSVSPEAESLLSSILQYDPNARPAPYHICADPFFDCIREESAKCPEGTPLPDALTVFSDTERRSMSRGLFARLSPSSCTAAVDSDDCSDVAAVAEGPHHLSGSPIGSPGNCVSTPPIA